MIDHDPTRCPVCSHPWHLRPDWTREDLALLGDDEVETAMEVHHHPWERGSRTEEQIDSWSRVADEWTHRRRRRRTAAQARTPRRYADVTLDGVTPRPAQSLPVETLQQEAASGRGCYLEGDSGRGKSYLAAAWLRSMAARGYTTRMVTLVELAAWDRQERDSETVRQCQTVDALVLDDAAAQGMSEYQIGLLLRVLEARCGEGMATTITSQLTIPRLEEVCGDRVATRVREMCRAVPV